MKNDKMAIIELSDMEIIEKIAKKYNLKMKDLGMIIARENTVEKPIQVRFTNSEFNVVKNAADERGLRINAFIRYSIRYARENKLLENMNIKDLSTLSKRDTKETRTKRVAVAFDKGEDFLEIKNFSEKMKIPYSNLIRWIVLKSV